MTNLYEKYTSKHKRTKHFIFKGCFIALRCTVFTLISSKTVPDTSLHETTNLM
jgi:hypothetical protein